MTSDSTAAAFPGMSNGMDNVSLPSEMSSVGGQVMYGSASVVAGEELGTKRRKLMKSDGAVGFPKICEMCNVTTNSPEVYRMHLAGRKHAAQVNTSILTSFHFVFCCLVYKFVLVCCFHGGMHLLCFP